MTPCNTRYGCRVRFDGRGLPSEAVTGLRLLFVDYGARTHGPSPPPVGGSKTRCNPDLSGKGSDIINCRGIISLEPRPRGTTNSAEGARDRVFGAVRRGAETGSITMVRSRSTKGILLTVWTGFAPILLLTNVPYGTARNFISQLFLIFFFF